VRPRIGMPPSAGNEVAVDLRCGLDSRVDTGVVQHGGLMRIVCSIDESLEARNAAHIAMRLAERLRAELVFVHSETGESSQPLGIRSPDRRCGLLVVGFKASTRLSSALLGDRYRRLVRDAACPVMLVPAPAQLGVRTNVVLGYDLPTVSTAEAAAAGRLAAALDSSLVVTHVDVPGRLSRRMRDQLHESVRRISKEAAVAAGGRLDVRHVERRGRASEQLDAVATSHDAGVIVVGTQRIGWRGLLHRSVATRLQRHERHAVLVVPRRASLAAS